MKPTILYCFAHPDDETFGCGGTIVHYHKLGATQILYCATHGEAGKTGNPPICTPDELGLVRANELQQAAQCLGIDQVILRDFGDSKLAQQPLDLIIQDLIAVMEDIRPDLIITFPPSGISGHPDHKIIQKATLEAVGKTSFPTKLYYIVIPESMISLHPSNISTVPDKWVSKKIRVTEYHEQIVQALKMHRTQHLSVERVFPGVLDGDTSHLPEWEHYQLVLQR